MTLTKEKLARKIHEEIRTEHAKACRAFNNLCADYLEAKAKQLRYEGDDDAGCYLLDKAADKLLWDVIHSPAETSYQLDFKFDLMRPMIETQVSDSRTEAMLESIRLDALGHWEN
jgi:hypothetical protein